MNLLNVPGVFGFAVGIVGLAFLADAAGQISEGSITDDPVGTYSGPSLNVSGLFNMSAFADEMGAPTDLSDLLRIDLPNANISLGDTVGSEVHSTVTIKKIAYGRVSNVNIYSTSTGAYSTDGLTSPHVQYPGIEVSNWYPHAPTPLGGFVWEGNFGWIPVPGATSHSFVTYGGGPNGFIAPNSGGMHCAEQSGVLICG